MSIGPGRPGEIKPSIVRSRCQKTRPHMFSVSKFSRTTGPMLRLLLRGSCPGLPTIPLHGRRFGTNPVSEARNGEEFYDDDCEFVAASFFGSLQTHWGSWRTRW